MKSLEDAISFDEFRRFVAAVEMIVRKGSLTEDAENCSQFDTVTRIAMMEAEIESLQQASYCKDNTKKGIKESQVREKLHQVRQRKARIDGKFIISWIQLAIALNCMLLSRFGARLSESSIIRLRGCYGLYRLYDAVSRRHESKGRGNGAILAQYLP